MREFYERHREENQDIRVLRNEDYSFRSHFHLNLEVLLVRRGKYHIYIGDSDHYVGDGGIAIVDSYEIHSYDPSLASGEIDDCVVIFPYRYLRRFNELRKNLKISTPVLYDAELCSELISIAEKYMNGAIQKQEAAADLFFALLCDKMSFSEEKARAEGALARRILSYVHENFRGDISRKSISKALGYTEAHISRVFNRYIGKGISEYINELRLAYTEQQRASGDGRKTIELIYEAGFKSQQTYYRVKGKAKQENDKK